ncbi:MAG: nitronate monooxygenase family protein [Acetobacteraceae bacterium]|nr:nitronate monooxygenase family protein [Acetobacteraceae bacterium]
MTPRDRAQRFCQRFGCTVPILQAPMAGSSPPALAAAVADAGGLGACGALQLGRDGILAWARDVRTRTNGAFQLNLWVPDDPPARDPAAEARVRAALGALGPAVPDAGKGPWLQDFEAQCEALLEAGPAIVSTIMGLFPAAFVARLRERGISWIANATTLDEALAAEAAGADAVIAQGAEAGGHRGSFAPEGAERGSIGLFALIPRFADALQVPVIAAGGVMDGRGIAAALTLGASAVQMGTAFLRCPEAAIHPAWAERLAAGTPEETVLTRGFSGRLARGLRNEVTQLFAREAPAPYPLQRVFTGPLREAAARSGNAEHMQLWAGQGVALSRAEPAGDLVRRVWAEAEALLA